MRSRDLNTRCGQCEPLVVAAFAVALAGCVSAPRLECPPGQAVMRSETLYFGTARAGVDPVTGAEWQAFLDDTVTPRFPDGLTVLEAAGQWRGASGVIVAERSRVLNVLHAGAPDGDLAFDAVVAEYKRRFDQESVLRVSDDVCVAF